MDHLWSPWRFRYISSGDQKPGCVFCLLRAEANDRKNLILFRKNHAFLILNRFPYTTGHLMVVTNRHIATLEEAMPDELTEMILLARESEGLLRKVYRPDGLNVGFNIGKSAGAGIAGHLHLHIVPRWEGDANVISVVGETRVIPEELETTYDKL
ncbi:MAG: HIT domain-containing protein, partial [Acidobacteriota bacterium]